MSGGGLPSRARVHPAERALSKMKKLELAENPKYGQWFILPAEHSQAESSEEQLKIETLDQFMEWARKFERGKYVFRGISNAAFKIQASAYRRPEEQDRNYEKFLQINRDLIREARLRGFDRKDGRGLRELEILADLQHFGAATCLIDFTHSAHIALWFACQPSSNKSKECKNSKECRELRDSEKSEECEKPPDGVVFTVRHQHPSIKEITPKLLKKDIDFFLKDGDESQLYHWQPRQQNHRIVAQQSIFLFGRYEFTSNGECVIDEGSKDKILRELQKVSGITEERLFPDFEGFARLRGEGFQYTEFTASDYVERSIVAYAREDYKDVLADCSLAIELQPDNPVTHYMRGSANYELKQYNEALADYDRAIDLDPDYADAYCDRGRLNYELEQYNEALADYDEVVLLRPYDAEGYSGRGLTKYGLEWYEEALEDFDKAISQQPNNADDYHYRGVVKVQLRQMRDALKDFDRAILLNPNHVHALYNRGIIKTNLSQYQSAIPDFDRVIRLDSERRDAYYHRARAKLRLNDLESAKKDLLAAKPLAISAGDDELVTFIDGMLNEIDFRLSRISRGSQDE